jgi:hypothetical protein
MAMSELAAKMQPTAEDGQWVVEMVDGVPTRQLRSTKAGGALLGTGGVAPAAAGTTINLGDSTLQKELAKAGVDTFTKLHESAGDSKKLIDNINRNLPLIADMPTGITANVELFARRVADAFGDNPDEAAANAQAYLADAGQRTAVAIKDFGSGTGLSDADREYAQGIAGGNITVTPQALTRILKMRRQVAEGIIEHFADVRGKLAKQLGDDSIIMDLYSIQGQADKADPLGIL